jgi:HlyD family secretion protein
MGSMAARTGVAVFVLGIAVSGCDRDSGAAREGVGATATPTAVVATRSSDEVSAEGRVVPVRSAVLSAAVAGTVDSVLVNEGEPVPAGRILVRLDGARASAGLLLARANLAAAEAGLIKVEMLGDRTGTPAPDEDVLAAQAAVDQARAQVELAQLGVDETVIRAPFAGTVAAVDARAADHVAPGTPLVYLADTSTWQIETDDLTELSIVGIGDGDPARITFDAIPDLEIEGRVVRIKGYGENKVGDITYTVVVAPDHSDPRLRWNMTASIVISTE